MTFELAHTHWERESKEGGNWRGLRFPKASGIDLRNAPRILGGPCWGLLPWLCNGSMEQEGDWKMDKRNFDEVYWRPSFILEWKDVKNCGERKRWSEKVLNTASLFETTTTPPTCESRHHTIFIIIKGGGKSWFVFEKQQQHILVEATTKKQQQPLHR